MKPRFLAGALFLLSACGVNHQSSDTNELVRDYDQESYQVLFIEGDRVVSKWCKTSAKKQNCREPVAQKEMLLKEYSQALADHPILDSEERPYTMDEVAERLRFLPRPNFSLTYDNDERIKILKTTYKNCIRILEQSVAEETLICTRLYFRLNYMHRWIFPQLRSDKIYTEQKVQQSIARWIEQSKSPTGRAVYRAELSKLLDFGFAPFGLRP